MTESIVTKLGTAFLFLLAASVPSSATRSKIEKRSFGKTAAGQAATLYLIKNAAGLEVAITDFGATVVRIKVPDRHGNISDVALGYDTVAEYESGKNYFGGTIGRYGNRIGHGVFSLGGQTYNLPKNDGENTLHGGIRGFNKRIWTAKEVSDKDAAILELAYKSLDGEEGFPGLLHVRVTFTVPKDRNEIRIHYSADTNKTTVVNLTNHSYFNLAGEGKSDILSHSLMINADAFTPVDDALIPTGEVSKTAGTPFDFSRASQIGARIGEVNQQLRFGKGYDHNWVLKKAADSKDSVLAARASDDVTGRVLEVWTTEPGLQFYSGNFLNDTVKGKNRKTYGYRSGFCLETQHFPDSPNRPNFPSTVLRPGERYDTATVFRFSTN